MPVTFRVDDVVQAPELPPTHTLAEHLGSVLALGGDASKRVVQKVHCPAPLLDAVHLAFAEHRPLVLSPDAVWLTILSGVALHVKLNAEALRSRLVRHRGKRELTVTLNESLEQNPAAMRDAVAGFRSQLAEEVGRGRAALLTCEFSTTTDVERAASEILLMDTFSPYFDYLVYAVCGIPEVTLLGEPADWRKMRERTDVLAELDLEWWTSSLAPILDELVLASEGRPNIRFFQEIYNPHDVYGGAVIAGWSARFYPYLSGAGRIDVRNPLLLEPLRSKKGFFSRKDDGAGISARDAPNSLGSCSVKVKDGQREYRLELRGGLVGVEVDERGALSPCAGWTVQHASPSIANVIEALRGRSDFVAEPAASLEPFDYFHFATADRLALADAFGQARLFTGSSEWVLRAPSEMQFLQVTVPRSSYEPLIGRVVDLPDGSFLALAYAGRGEHVVLRIAESALEPLPEDDSPIQVREAPSHRVRLAPDDIAVVGNTLAEVLERALATGGALPEAVARWSAVYRD